jgi:hypothetical protein
MLKNVMPRPSGPRDAWPKDKLHVRGIQMDRPASCAARIRMTPGDDEG